MAHRPSHRFARPPIPPLRLLVVPPATRGLLLTPASPFSPGATGTWALYAAVALLLVGLGALLGTWWLRGTPRQGLPSVVTPQPNPPPRAKETDDRSPPLVALDEKKKHFFANVSHELRTPLTLLHGALDDALDEIEGPAPSPVQRRLKHMRTHVNRLRHLADRLLDLSRLNVTTPTLHPEPRDLVAFLRHLVRAFTPAAERAGVRLHLETEHSAYPCRFDSEKLQKVVGNLLSNAITFTPNGGVVTVSFETEADPEREDVLSIVQVSDTGRGIPANRQDEVFDRFASFRALDGNQTGTGIGLTLAREFTRMHGGTIDLESAPGAGSTFTVRLPLPSVDAENVPDSDPDHTPATPLCPPPIPSRTASPEHPFKEEPSPTARDRERPLLLIVDDNADVRAYLRRHLDSLGTVVEASDGAEGLDTVREAHPDLVLANVVMPKLDGLSLTRRVRADDDLDRMPILLLTARATAADAVAGLEAGADDYVRKPFSMDELRARLEQLLKAHRAWTANSEPDAALLTPDVDVTPADEAFLDRVTNVIEDNLDRADFTVDDLAAGVGVSPRHLQRKVKRLTGCPAAEFVRRYRLECAAELLASDAGTVSEIAYSVGFGTPKTFVKHFKTHFDCTPSAYAEEHGD